MRTPYQSFDFPRIEEGIQTAIQRSFTETIAQNVRAQEKRIRMLKSSPPPPEIQPLYNGVIDLFEREHAYSRAVLQFFKNKDPRRFISSLDAKFFLDQEERKMASKLAKQLLSGNTGERLRTTRDQSFNRHIMRDREGKHFTDLHQDFMKKHKIQIDCTCITNC